MHLDPAARVLHLRFEGGGIASDAGLYGAGQFGDTQTWGQEVGESAVTGIRYELMPYPGWHPGPGAWRYRIGDTEEEFVAVCGNYENPTERLDLSSVALAALTLRETSLSRNPWTAEFPLELNEDMNTFERSWLPGDLTNAGEFAATVRIIFDSGRGMTIEPRDDTTFIIASGGPT